MGTQQIATVTDLLVATIAGCRAATGRRDFDALEAALQSGRPVETVIRAHRSAATQVLRIYRTYLPGQEGLGINPRVNQLARDIAAILGG